MNPFRLRGRPGLRHLVLAIVVALSASGSPARTVAADPSSDIPGIPLPGPIVTGILGGPVYDVVYQLDVPPGTVILADLQGSSGTDFDLYLFDATATTILNNVGVVARSIGPSSEESIAYPTPLGGRFYLDLNGVSELSGTYTLLVQSVRDGTPPTVTIQLEGGRPVVGETLIDVALTAVDDLSGVTEMAFSLDGATYGPWLPFTPQARVIVASGDGLKSISAKVRNGVGLESAPAVATITLDTRPPQVVEIVPSPGSRVPALRPTFTIQFDEAVEPESWLQHGLVVQAPDASSVPGTYTLDARRLVGMFTPGADLVPGLAYALSLGAVTDAAGNRLAGQGAWTVTPVQPAQVFVAASPSVIVWGGTTSIAGRYDRGAPPQPMTLSTRPGGATEFGPPNQIASAADGSFRLDVRPEMNTTFRVAAAGSNTVADAAAEVRVLVRRQVTLLGDGGASGSTRAGRTVVLTARVGPATPRASVSFRLYRWDASRRSYRYAGSWGRVTDAAGVASYTWTPGPGVYRWRVSVAPSAEYANNISRYLPWKVSP